MPEPASSRIWIPRDPSQPPGLAGPVITLVFSFLILVPSLLLGAITWFALKIGPDINGGNAVLLRRVNIVASLSGIGVVVCLLWLGVVLSRRSRLRATLPAARNAPGA